MAKDNIFLPKTVTYQKSEENKNQGSIIIKPCYPGYGTTWGNALRRVLLTSLPGGAVTAVKIKGARYEFSSINGVKEDVLEIILNLKLLKLKIHGDHSEPIKLELKSKGKGKVKAKDIEKNSDVEIANPDLVIANITNSKTELEMEIFVEGGFGWKPSEKKSDKNLGIGVILTDSAYSPIKKVGIEVEDVRVGERTDYDKLTLNITTDGTLTPKQAFIKSSALLSEQFSFLNSFLQSGKGDIAKGASKKKSKSKSKKKKSKAKSKKKTKSKKKNKSKSKKKKSKKKKSKKSKKKSKSKSKSKKSKKKSKKK